MCIYSPLIKENSTRNLILRFFFYISEHGLGFHPKMGSGSRLELESEFAQWEQFLYSPVLRSGLESESETISESVSGNVNKPQSPIFYLLRRVFPAIEFFSNTSVPVAARSSS